MEEDPATIATLIREIHGDLKVVTSQMAEVVVKQSELAEHQREANGRTLKLELSVAEANGAINLGKWMFGSVIALLSLGVALAGVVLTILIAT